MFRQEILLFAVAPMLFGTAMLATLNFDRNLLSHKGKVDAPTPQLRRPILASRSPADPLSDRTG